ncbi:hypothetical protein [Endozoicomonas numazuensis]|uniref:Uncharacterized protein n=1 Tax=Endozoicomonas numazuensis TaxID=1137799 RepID=A0A081NGJ5_9GAMM|nr:hypothetical protein [Endozoicomonas numazuensis]KEQ17568.1 hypothetical protein GZ78_17685 [Endozoicomonas numazuensis]
MNSYIEEENVSTFSIAAYVHSKKGTIRVENEELAFIRLRNKQFMLQVSNKELFININHRVFVCSRNGKHFDKSDILNINNSSSHLGCLSNCVVKDTDQENLKLVYFTTNLRFDELIILRHFEVSLLNLCSKAEKVIKSLEDSDFIAFTDEDLASMNEQDESVEQNTAT